MTQLDEYYLTRTGCMLLIAAAPNIANRLPSNAPSAEYGASGEAGYLQRQHDGVKHPVLHPHVPIDVAVSVLQQMRMRVRMPRQDLLVHPIAADFLEPIVLPGDVAGMARLGFSPGLPSVAQ